MLRASKWATPHIAAKSCWFLLTLPPGFTADRFEASGARAEVHIPLFYIPTTEEEKRNYFTIPGEEKWREPRTRKMFPPARLKMRLFRERTSKVLRSAPKRPRASRGFLPSIRAEDLDAVSEELHFRPAIRTKSSCRSWPRWSNARTQDFPSAGLEKTGPHRSAAAPYDTKESLKRVRFRSH